MCEWIEDNCVLGEGDYFGQRVKLRRWQRNIIWRLYETRPDGKLKHRRALIGLPKGNGKTPLAAWIGAYELAGGAKTSPTVCFSAASFEQADLVFGDMKTMFRESPTLAPVAHVYDTEIVLAREPGRAFRTAAARGSNDGARLSCYIADELHEFNDPAKEGAHLVLSNATVKRDDSLQLNITTAGSDLDSLLGRLYLKGKRIEAGEEDDPEFLFVWHEAPEGVDITHADALRAAIRSCNPAADDFLNVERIAARARELPEFEFRRYYLNQWTRAGESWLPPGAWDACAGDNAIPEGAEIVAACDMALFHDSTAIVWAWRRPDGRMAIQSRVWFPDKATNRIDHVAVKQFMRELCSRYDVRRIVGDPRFLELMFAELGDEGLPVQDFPQSSERMAPACGTAYDAIVNRTIVHGADATLTDHVLSATVRQHDRGWTLSKGKSKRKIDACIALVMVVYEMMRPQPVATREPAQLLYL